MSVEVTMNPGNGIRIHISNPMKRGLSAPNEREVPSATVRQRTCRPDGTGDRRPAGHADTGTTTTMSSISTWQCRGSPVKPIE